MIFFSAKNINVFAIFQDRNFNVMLANNLVSFEQMSPDLGKSTLHTCISKDKQCLGETQICFQQTGQTKQCFCCLNKQQNLQGTQQHLGNFQQ